MKRFEEIWYEYYPKLTVYLRTSFHFNDTEDLVQEIMMKVNTNMHRYNSTRSISTWIYSIARNHAIDTLRKENTRLRVLENIQVETAAAARAVSGSDCKLIADELKDDITVFIDSLPEAERQCAFLKYYEEMSYRDINRVTGIPVGTIKYHIYNVKQKFSTFYGEQYEN